MRQGSAARNCQLEMSVPSGAYWLQVVTIAWMLVECSVSLLSALRAHNLMLAAFGGDSLIELLSAVFVLYSFSPQARLSKKSVDRCAGALLYALAVIVGVTAVWKLVAGNTSESSLTGMALTAAALIVMPILARFKRHTARQIGSTALSADAVQSTMCAYLSAIALTSLTVERFFRVHWVDAIASLIALPILVVEANRTIRGQGCCC